MRRFMPKPKPKPMIPAKMAHRHQACVDVGEQCTGKGWCYGQACSPHGGLAPGRCLTCRSKGRK